MATYRIGIGSFNLKDGAVGLGTESSGLGNLKVEGTVKTTDLDVTGVSTFTRYAGFVADNLNIVRDTSLTGEHSTQGDIVVGLNSTFTVSTGATVTVGTVESVSIGTHFSPPTGGVEERPEAVHEGMVRYNTDIGTLEFYNGIEWKQFIVNGASGRGLIMGGTGLNTKHLTSIDYISIPTTGNTVSFGELLEPVDGMGATSSSIRAVTFGGTQNPGSSNSTVNTMQYVTISSSGNSIDFGDLVGTHRYPMAATNGTRAILFGGSGSPGYKSGIEMFNISTLGNATDTGGDAKAVSNGESVYSPTRAIFVSGYFPSSPNIQKHTHHINITSTGDTADFGDGIYFRSGTGMSNNTRGIIGGGRNPEVNMNSMYYITIASLGNYEQFGDLIEAGTGRGNGNMTTQTRGVFCGGATPAPARINTMEYVTFSSLGNGVNFGDLTSKCGDGASTAYTSVASDSHGGLGGY